MLVTRVEITGSLCRDRFISPRLCNNLSALPPRVAAVRAVALPPERFSARVSARGKDMVMNSRTLFPVTLMALVWFSPFARITKKQEQAPPIHEAATSQIKISDLMQRAHDGDAKAEYLLGRSYMTGSGLPQDYVEASKWFQKAAAQGSAEATFGLGYLYEQGKGVSRDYRQAMSYYTVAAKQGDSTAANNLASMFERGEGVHKNPREAEHWYQVAADQGNVTAQCNLASLYFRGRGVPRDYTNAVKWFRAAAESGYAPAQENLAWMYYTGTGVSVDYPKQRSGCSARLN